MLLWTKKGGKIWKNSMSRQKNSDVHTHKSKSQGSKSMFSRGTEKLTITEIVWAAN